MGSYEKLVMSLWAKKEDRLGQLLWLPLKQHLLDTMNVSRWLWENWLSDSQRKFCIKSISSATYESASNLAAFLGAIHDIGKATPVFQTQKRFHNKDELSLKLIENLENAGFVGISSLVLISPQKTHHALAGEYLLKKEFNLRDDIGSIVGAHHGKPIDSLLSLEEQAAYPINYYQSDKDTITIERWKLVQREIFNWALENSGFDSVEQLPIISKSAQVFYSGLTIMADWISSNSDYFPLINIGSESISDSDTRSKDGIKLWGEHLPLLLPRYPPMEEIFVSRFGFEPRDFQKIVYQTLNLIQNPGIIILEAPMGLGKTEAALVASEILAAKTGSSGLFFGLPTQATSNGMFNRVHDWLKNIIKEYGISQSIRLCHGKAALNEEMNSLINKASPKSINVDEKLNGSVFVNQWFSGRKKTALDDFVVGTVDNFLLSALKQNHLALRHLGFSKKIVVIDEVHAYDAYMQQYLYEAVKWMGAYGVPVILTSATLYQTTRKKLISSYLRGMGVKKIRDVVFPKEMSGDGYPLISYTDGLNVKVETGFYNIEDKLIHIKSINEEELLNRLSVMIDRGGVVGIIVNTIKKAQDLGKRCKDFFGNDVVEILHSAFIATDRITKEMSLLCTVGKFGKRPERKIIIGTQVIEQSLDIDFDVLITDLCPIDLLLQRIGRLQRHNRKRPDAHSEPIVYVMGFDENFNFDIGSETIYGKYLLIRTQYYLPETIRIPSDIPHLINKVYDTCELELSGELLRTYQESRNKNYAENDKKGSKAKTYLVQSPIPIGSERTDLIGWLNNSNNCDSEELEIAQVRDIKETVEVIAVKKVGDGYGTFENNIDVSKQINEPRVAKEVAKQTIRLPYFVSVKGGVSKIIEDLEKYNSTNLREWQEQSWLKGSLGIIFDENGRFVINGIQLKYDSEFGLREEINYGEV